MVSVLLFAENTRAYYLADLNSATHQQQFNLYSTNRVDISKKGDWSINKLVTDGYTDIYLIRERLKAWYLFVHIAQNNFLCLMRYKQTVVLLTEQVSFYYYQHTKTCYNHLTTNFTLKSINVNLKKQAAKIYARKNRWKILLNVRMNCEFLHYRLSKKATNGRDSP